MPPTADWTLLQRMLFRFLLLFVVLFLSSYSFPHEWLPDPGAWTSPFFERCARWMGDRLGIQKPYLTALVSDSTGFYLNALFLLLISFLLALLWSGLDRKRRGYPRLWAAFRVLLRYYLAMQLLAYGCNKLFKWQFFFPEPNTLYTKIGEAPPDFLFWTAMGVSRTYSVVTGAVEVLAALLLLFRRTTLAGALLAAAALAHILLLNLSFDISVKLYSCFLFLLALLLLAPHIRRMLRFFSGAAVAEQHEPRHWPFPRPWIKGALKALVILLLFGDALAPYLQTRNFNDDAQPRPFLHGAYEVQTFLRNGDTLPPLLTDTTRWRRLFIHRRGYLIVQGMDDRMLDYELEYDTTNRYLWINRPGDSIQTNLAYRLSGDSLLHLEAAAGTDRLFIHLRRLDLSRLPASQRDFHWTIDRRE